MLKKTQRKHTNMVNNKLKSRDGQIWFVGDFVERGEISHALEKVNAGWNLA